MTLSPDDRFVYATGIWTGSPDKGRKPSLLAIDAQTGNTGEWAFAAETKAFHTPVVVQHPGGADYVFVGANSGTTGALRCIMNTSTARAPVVDPSGDTTAKLAACGGGWKDVDGFVGQPLLDGQLPGSGDLSGKTLFAVVGRKLAAIPAQKGTAGPDPYPTWDLPGLPDGALHLWSGGGHPAMDADGNVTFWENGRLFVLPGKGAARSVWSMILPTLSTDANVGFGAGGLLYASEPNRQVRTLMPHYQLPMSGVTQLALPQVELSGALDAGALTVTSSGVILRPGFSVKRGATFAVAPKP